MKATYDDYERFRALDNTFHAIVMKASGNEVGLTIVRTIHTHGGVMPPLASAASRAALKRTVDAHRAIYEALDSTGRRDGGRADLGTYPLRVGREEEVEAIRLTTADHSYDDHPQCGSQLSMSS